MTERFGKKPPSPVEIVVKHGRPFTAKSDPSGVKYKYEDPPRQEPEWRKLSMTECAAAIDADLALRDMELSDHDMFVTCDHLTKGWPVQIVGRPRRGTAEGDRVAECVRRYYARVPLSSRYVAPERTVWMQCESPNAPRF